MYLLVLLVSYKLYLVSLLKSQLICIPIPGHQFCLFAIVVVAVAVTPKLQPHPSPDSRRLISV